MGCDGIRRTRISSQLSQITEAPWHPGLTHTEVLCHNSQRTSTARKEHVEFCSPDYERDETPHITQGD